MSPRNAVTLGTMPGAGSEDVSGKWLMNGKPSGLVPGAMCLHRLGYRKAWPRPGFLWLALGVPHDALAADEVNWVREQLCGLI